jgi:hypothetical protein
MKTTGMATASFVLIPGTETMVTPYLVNNYVNMNELPFIFGTQYFRVPTPEPACWEADFDKMNSLGFTDVKFFV